MMNDSLSVRRKRWRSRLQEDKHALWPEIHAHGTVGIQQGAQRRGASRIIFGEARDQSTCVPFCIKFVPDADPRNLALTEQRLNWWRAHHPKQADHVPRIIAAWPDERVIVMTRESGLPLGHHLQRSPIHRLFSVGAQEQLVRGGHALGVWLRRFAAGLPPYDIGIQPMLGQRSSLTMDGRLAVDARRLLSVRIEHGHRAADTLVRAGVRSARNWSDRFCLDSIERSISDDEQAGFVHGDVKPDNVLVDENRFSLIDWWVAPRVSWPLTDLANFAGNLRLGGESTRTTLLWKALVDGYFKAQPDERTLATIDLVSCILRLTHAAACLERRMSRFILTRRVHRWLAGMSTGHRLMALGTGACGGPSL